jgi:hypothetical protein
MREWITTSTSRLLMYAPGGASSTTARRLADLAVPERGRRRHAAVRSSDGPIVERIGSPISKVPWSPELVAQSLEILPVGLDEGRLFWLRPIHAPSLRVGISKSAEPSHVVVEVVSSYELHARIVHSTSWRYEDGRIVLTYVVVVEPPHLLPPDSLELAPIQRSDLARGAATAPPDAITVNAVLEHAVRHLAWLHREDRAIAAELTGWSDVLDAYAPEPFRALS